MINNIKKSFIYIIMIGIFSLLFIGCGLKQISPKENLKKYIEGKIIKIEKNYVFIQNKNEIIQIEKSPKRKYEKNLYLRVLLNKDKKIIDQKIIYK